MTSVRGRVVRWLDERARTGVVLGSHEVEVVRDLRVPMPDGVHLLADLHRPVGADGTLPTIVIRGPYGRRGTLGRVARMLAYEGFPVLFQSCRGTGGSEGVFRPQLDEQRDGIATHRWVRRQPWFTGRLATFGESYMGYTQWAVAAEMQRNDPDQAPEAYVLQITMPDFGAVTWDNGAFALQNALGWSRMMDRMSRGLAGRLAMLLPDPRLGRAFDVLPLSAGDAAVAGRPIPWYQDWVSHEDLTHPYWTQQSYTDSVGEVTAPALMITGWYDIFLPWQLRDHAAMVAAGNPPLLTVGPWGHMTPEKAAPAHQNTVAFLKSTFADEPWPRPAPVRAYRTGSEDWHDLPSWPPPGTAVTDWFLHADGRVTEQTAAAGITEYVYDPEHPTPAVGGPSLGPDTAPADNAAHERRGDVVAFRSEELSAPIDIAGEPTARVRIRSSARSFDVFVRITDVHPDGRVMTVCDGIRRIGSLGTRASDPEPDGEGFREVEIPLWPTFHRFRRGHRIGVQLSSGAHPRYARNPGTGIAAATAERTVVAEQVVAHGGEGGTRIGLPVRTG